ncbi:MAG: nucleotide exchange factor GrpE, partial [Polaromonas sp.]|nr:nucleotide exchange factor GrpE [Polaromonas sp.]
MSDNTPPDHNQELSGEPSPEELEAAQAANEADALSTAQAELAVLQAKNTELADSYL